MRRPAPGSLWTDASRRMFVAVVIAGDAGGGMAYVKIEPFDPRRPEMIAAWSHLAESLRPYTPSTGDEPTVITAAWTPGPLPRRDVA